MRRLVLALALLACKREKHSEPAATSSAPQGGSYSELVGATQKGSATETRPRLACASDIPVPERAERAFPTPPSEREWDKRQARLVAMNGDTLAREATPDELVSMVIDRLMKSQDASKPLSPAELDVMLASNYDGEVNNGGHHQFFFNSSGDDAVETRDALARIGAADLLAIYDCALTAFPTSKPARDRDKRNEELARWGEKQFLIFERLDSAYYASSSWQAAVVTYIRAHIAEMPNARLPAR